ncbi:hypothetical protein ACIQGW_23985 [Lysinibacillus xylanilyticus]|uniref:hypothetical protein n=1 Tax=Lysinibacillus xylanilyticus TaxID=582475 RepID=UPI00382C6894
MSNKKVYILLTDTGALFAKAIKLYTRKPYNHASISFDGNLTQVYSFGRKNPRNPFIGGFVKEDINEGLFLNADCVVYSLTIKEADYYRMELYIKKIEAQKEYYHYNLMGLFAIIIIKKLKRKNAFFCSEFVASVLKQGKGIEINSPPSLLKPCYLYCVASFELVFQGKLRDYNKVTINQPNISEIGSSHTVVSAGCS